MIAMTSGTLVMVAAASVAVVARMTITATRNCKARGEQGGGECHLKTDPSELHDIHPLDAVWRGTSRLCISNAG
jgi:hypothetical protein